MGHILIKDVPLEVRRYIYQLQSELKLQREGCTSQYSQSAVIIKIIKKQMALENKKNKKEDD